MFSFDLIWIAFWQMLYRGHTRRGRRASLLWADVRRVSLWRCTHASPNLCHASSWTWLQGKSKTKLYFSFISSYQFLHQLTWDFGFLIFFFIEPVPVWERVPLSHAITRESPACALWWETIQFLGLYVQSSGYGQSVVSAVSSQREPLLLCPHPTCPDAPGKSLNFIFLPPSPIFIVSVSLHLPETHKRHNPFLIPLSFCGRRKPGSFLTKEIWFPWNQILWVPLNLSLSELKRDDMICQRVT